MAASFCHLHVHTEYSLLDGACRVERMAETAARMGMPAVAMTDHGNMFGVVPFCNAMRGAGVKPIIGYEAYLTPGDRRDRTYTGGKQDLFHLTLLARDRTGLQNLMRMSSLAYMEGFYYKPRVDWELLSANCEGVIALSGCLASRLNALVLTDREAEAEAWLGEMRDLFGPESFYVEVQDHGLADQRVALPKAIRLARKLDIPLAASNDAHYLQAGDHAWHDVLLCINTRSTLDAPDRFRLESDQLYFKSAQEMAALFGDEPDALANTLKIAEMCDVELDESLKYPTFHEQGVEDNAAFLRELAGASLKVRYGELQGEMRERLDHELGVIEQMGYVDYFLIVWDFVRFARGEGIPIGMRGSGCGSLVSHAIGLTDFNPMDYGLLFSRFLDPERRESPDIDIDLCEKRREEVIQYVRERYGEQSTAQIITFGTLAPRNAMRDVGRVLDVPLSVVDKAAKMFPSGPKITFEKGLKAAPELVEFARQDEQVGRILEYAPKIEGIPRHAAKHAAGVVIADKPLYELIPLYQSGDGVLMTQWAMNELEQVGMLKMDFLGLRTQTIIDRALRLIEERLGEAPSLDAADLDLHDKATYELLSAGDATGVFQFGSDGMKQLLRKLQPTGMEDLIAVSALYRPGPLGSGAADDFIERRHGRAPVEYPHPSFEPILAPTYGLIVFQEQIMRILNEIAGVSMAEALTTIKAISKKKKKVIKAGHEAFIRGAVAKGLDEATAEDVFEQIMEFAGYGFNRAHTTAYAFVAFRTAYLKAHYPTEFMAASISCEMGHTDDVVELMEDCARMGIEVLPPDVNESGLNFRVVREGVIRFGMGAIKNLGVKAIEAVLQEREAGGPYKSIFEFCERVSSGEVNRSAAEALLKAGCFDELPGERAQQIAVLDQALKAGARVRRDKAMGQTSLFGAVEDDDPVEHAEHNLPAVPPLSVRELAAQEAEALGLYVRYDPLQEHRQALRRVTSATSEDLEALGDGDPVVVGGLVESVRKRRTRDGRPMADVRLLDLKGHVECVMFSEAYEKHVASVESHDVLLLCGTMGRGPGGQPSVRVTDVIDADAAARRFVESVVVRVPCESVGGGVWREIKSIITRHKGPLPVLLDLESNGVVLRCSTGNGHTVTASERLAIELEELLGADAVHFELRVDGLREKAPAWKQRRRPP